MIKLVKIVILYASIFSLIVFLIITNFSEFFGRNELVKNLEFLLSIFIVYILSEGY